MILEKYTIAVAVNDKEVLTNNLLLSPGISNGDKNQLLFKDGYPSASLAYNAAIEEADNDIIIFVHQDIFFPEGWFSNLSRAINYLDNEKSNWAVLGCFGSEKGRAGGVGEVYTTGLGIHGNEIRKPEAVETLDEILLVVRKSSGLRFDPLMPHFHLYGTDICLSARKMGLSCFAFPGFCIHNTNQLLELPKEFYACYHYIKKKWSKSLPIYASCIKIDKFDCDIKMKKLKSIYKMISGRAVMAKSRVTDPTTLLHGLDQAKFS